VHLQAACGAACKYSNGVYDSPKCPVSQPMPATTVRHDIKLQYPTCNLSKAEAYVSSLPQRLTLPPRRYLGYRPPNLAHADLPVRIPAPSQPNSVTAIDWRSNGCVSAIQNQVRSAHAACRRR
jgi:hypothetical protein